MKSNDQFSKNEFSVKCYNLQLPFEFFTLEYILSELEKRKELFGSFVKIENSTKAKIKKYYKENKKSLGENTRFLLILNSLLITEQIMDLLVARRIIVIRI